LVAMWGKYALKCYIIMFCMYLCISVCSAVIRFLGRFDESVFAGLWPFAGIVWVIGLRVRCLESRICPTGRVVCIFQLW